MILNPTEYWWERLCRRCCKWSSTPSRWKSSTLVILTSLTVASLPISFNPFSPPSGLARFKSASFQMKTGLDLREVGRDCLALGLVSVERLHSHIISLFLEIPSLFHAFLVVQGSHTIQYTTMLHKVSFTTKFIPLFLFIRLKQIGLFGVNLSAVPGDLLALVKKQN